MSDINPYAAPSTSSYQEAPESSWEGLWRENNDLVMEKEARLPNLCVKTGIPTTERGITKKLSWFTPWMVLSLFMNFVVFIVLILIFTKRATIQIPLSTEERSKRSTRIIVCSIFGVASLVIGVASVTYLLLKTPPFDLRNETLSIALTCLSFPGCFIAWMLGHMATVILRPTRITDNHIWLRGVHPSILDQLPPIPPEIPHT